MNTNTVIKLLAVVLFLGLGFLAFSAWTGGDGESDEPVVVVDPLEAGGAADLTPAAPAEEESVIKAPERMEVQPLAGPGTWHGELAGLTGRVIEADGTPVSKISVALLEFDTDILFAANLTDPEAPQPSLVLEETITDESGRFRLGGARATVFHGLGVDLGGARATFRVLDSSLVHGERTDIGDVILAPYGILSGRILDERGAGIGGARIRVGPFPEEVLMTGAWEAREDSLLAISMLLTNGGGQGVIELPRWVRKMMNDFPIPTAYTDETGFFRLEGVALAKICGGIDKPGYAGIPLGPIDMRDAPEQDLGELILTDGRTIQGVVEDGGGDPIVGVDVFAGAEVPAGFVAILQPCGQTDENGEFSLSGVPGDGQVVAITRRTKSEPWTSEVTSHHDDMILSLESAIQLTVLVKNEAGEPLSKADVRLQPASKGDGGMMGMGQITMFLPRELDPDSGFREVEPGRYVDSTVTPGYYHVLARVEGLARGRETAEIVDEESEVTVTCPTGTHLTVTALDAATQKPVAGARARILKAGMTGFEQLADGKTDEEGNARLGPLGEAEEEGMFSETMLLVRHEDYADHSDQLETRDGETVVLLQGGGVLTGRVHWDGDVPTRLYMLSVEYRGANGFAEMFHLPRFGLTDLAGAFRVEDLGAGEYRVNLMERFLDQDPLGFIDTGFEPATLHRETVEITTGQETELVINLTATGRGPTAAIRGRVRVDGRAIEGAEVTVRGNGSTRTTTDAWGRFETEEFSVQRGVWVSIEGDVKLPGGEGTSRMNIYQESLELQAGEVREIEVDLVPLEVRAEVVESGTGDPIFGAAVHARPNGNRRRRQGGFQEAFFTDSSGLVTVWVSGPGEYRLSADADGYAEVSKGIEVPETGFDEVVRLEVFRAVPCRGRVVVAGYQEGGSSFSYLWVRNEETNSTSGTMISGPDFEFDLEGLPPGTYVAQLYVSGQEMKPVSFRLGPDGDERLILESVPTED